eukprot:3140784-Amphidinium_carterae.2
MFAWTKPHLTWGWELRHLPQPRVINCINTAQVHRSCRGAARTWHPQGVALSNALRIRAPTKTLPFYS